MNTPNYLTYNKAALRDACKTRGISYSKLDNEGMRKALKKWDGEYAAAEAAKQPAPVVTTDASHVDLAPEAPEPMSDPSRLAAAAAAKQPEKAAKPAPAPKDNKNGITRPGPGKCRDVWDACDAIIAAGQKVTLAGIKEKVPEINNSTARTQMQRHKTYHG